MQQLADNSTYIGYARVSTEDQRLDLQLNALRKFGVSEDMIFCEHYTGKTLTRPQFIKAQKYLRSGDTFVVWKLDRVGRNTAEVSAFALELEKWGVKLKSLTEGIDTDTACGRFMFHNVAAVAQLERDMTAERTKAGLQAARERETWKPRKLLSAVNNGLLCWYRVPVTPLLALVLCATIPIAKAQEETLHTKPYNA